MLPKHTFEWSARSVSGSRKEINDDSWIAFATGGQHGTVMLATDDERTMVTSDLIYAVSDGMGGGNAGNVASALILEYLSEHIPETFRAAAAGFYPDYLARLEDIITKIHHAINEKGEADENRKGMAATLTLAWFTPDNMYFAHVGDSRLYRYRDGELQQLSQDHTFVWKQFQRGEISELQFRNHPRRSALYNVMGGGHFSTTPQVDVVDYKPGDRFMLCSDGIVDGLGQKSIAGEFSENLDSTSSLADACISRAIENDGTDDTTLITICVK